MKVLFAQTFNMGAVAVLLFALGINLKRRFLIRALKAEADLRQEPGIVEGFLLTDLLEPDLDFLAAGPERCSCLLPLLASWFVSFAGIVTGAWAFLYGGINGLFSDRLGTVILISGSTVLLVMCFSSSARSTSKLSSLLVLYTTSFPFGSSICGW